MPLTDWTAYKDHASMSFILETTAPLLGSGSYRMNRNGQTAQLINAVRTNTPKGFTAGRARFLLGAKTIINSDQPGYAFMQSQEDLTSGTYSYYVASLLASTTAGSNRLRLIRETNSGSTVLVTGPTFSFSVGSVIPIEVTWIYDPTNLGGGADAARLIVKRGAATDFSDLATEAGMDIITTTNVLTNSVAEGPSLILTSTSSNGDYLWDSFHVRRILVGG